MKSGFKTTEFWGRAIVTIIGLLVGSGAVQPEVGQKITDATNATVPIIQMIIDGIVQLTGIIVAAVLQFKQGSERSNLKMMGIKASVMRK